MYLSYESIFDSITSASDWFLTEFFTPLIDFIKDTPLVSASIIVGAGLPLFLLVLLVFRDASVGTMEELYRPHSLINKYRKNKIKKEKEAIESERQKAIEAQRNSRGYNYSGNNKYVTAYLSSLQHDKK